eukprot:scaffold13560_cov161-Cylindrotheca_fusiformis.AAC.5
MPRKESEVASYYVKLCVIPIILFLQIRASLFLDLESYAKDLPSRNQNSSQTFNFKQELVLDFTMGPAAHRAKYRGFQNRASNRGHNRSDWDRLTISECNAQGVDEFLPLREIQIQKLPQAILIGVQKGGTSALHSYLSQHPDVEMMEKELYVLDETLDYYFLDPSNEPSIPRKRGRELYSQKTLGVAQKWNLRHHTGPLRKRALDQIVAQRRNERAQRLHPNFDQSRRQKSNDRAQNHTAGRLSSPYRQNAQENLYMPSNGKGLPPRIRPKPSQMMERRIESRANKKSLRMALDMTPNYMLHSDRVPARIHCLVPWVQIFVILRDPIERAQSQFDMKIRLTRSSAPNNKKQEQNGGVNDEDLVNLWGNPVPSFDQYVRDDVDALYEVGVLQDWTKVNFEDFWNSEECWKAWQSYIHLGLNAPIGMGLYALQLKPFLDMLQTIHGKNQSMDKFLAIDNRNLKTDPNGTFLTLLQFLNLQPFSLGRYRTVNSSGGKLAVKRPTNELSEETKHKVQSAIEPYNNKLADMIGEEWRNKWS